MAIPGYVAISHKRCYNSPTSFHGTLMVSKADKYVDARHYMLTTSDFVYIHWLYDIRGIVLHSLPFICVVFLEPFFSSS